MSTSFNREALTLVETIFAIVIIGILSAIMAPQFTRSTLTEAAHQIVLHIRYTQHLAMVDNRFDPNEKEWYKGRWQIFFAKTDGSDKKWAYTIFADKRGPKGLTGFPDTSEIARNPQNPTAQYLTGGYTWGNIPYRHKTTKKIDSRVTKEMNLGHKYNIKEVKFKGGCRSRSRRIAFDYLGRPLFGNSTSLTSKYMSHGRNRLIQTPCQIILSNKKDSITIQIEPETGYTYIL